MLTHFSNVAFRPLLITLSVVVCGSWVTVAAMAGDVVIVLSGEAEPYRLSFEAAKEQLHADGHHVTSLWVNRDTHNLDPLPDRTDAVIAIGTSAAQLLHKQLPANTPLFYTMVADPTKTGLARGRQALGVTTTVPLYKQFELIRRAIPKVSALGLLVDSRQQTHTPFMEKVRQDLPPGWTLHAIDKKSYPSTAKAVKALYKSEIDLVLTYPDPAVFDGGTVRALLLASLRRKIPVFGYSPQFVRAGAVLGTGMTPQDQGAQIGRYVRRYLANDPEAVRAVQNGRKPLEPVHVVAVNLIAARRISISVSPEVVKQAAHVYQKNEGG